jgi:hypothetical protein
MQLARDGDPADGGGVSPRLTSVIGVDVQARPILPNR